jgi:hypothetical protein
MFNTMQTTLGDLAVITFASLLNAAGNKSDELASLTSNFNWHQST